MLFLFLLLLFLPDRMTSLLLNIDKITNQTHVSDFFHA